MTEKDKEVVLADLDEKNADDVKGGLGTEPNPRGFLAGIRNPGGVVGATFELQDGPASRTVASSAVVSAVKLFDKLP